MNLGGLENVVAATFGIASALICDGAKPDNTLPRRKLQMLAGDLAGVGRSVRLARAVRATGL